MKKQKDILLNSKNVGNYLKFFGFIKAIDNRTFHRKGDYSYVQATHLYLRFYPCIYSDEAPQYDIPYKEVIKKLPKLIKENEYWYDFEAI